MCIHGHGTGFERSLGFTVLELMVTLSIATILLLTATPSLRQFSMRQAMKAAVTSLQSDLLFARSQAVFGNVDTIACPGAPDTGCSEASDWSGGWIVFGDANGDQRRQSSEALLRHGYGIENVRVLGTSGRTRLRFFPDGSAPGSNGTISLCGLNGPAGARKLVVSNVGRVRRDLYPDIDPARCPLN